MKNIIKYSFFEMVRSRWVYIYTLFYLISTLALYFISQDTSKVLISMTNIVLALAPLIGILFGTTYYYNSKEFINLLLSQPLSRWNIFLGTYAGLAITLCLSILVGIALPLIVLGDFSGNNGQIFGLMIFLACVLSIIFSLLAFDIAMRFDDKVKGLSFSIFLWLFFAVIYDGIILLLMLLFKDYPLDNLTIGAILLNPIDLARILIMMKLDVSAMMGYTGAVISKFLGKGGGLALISFSLLLWTLIPLFTIKKLGNTKDF